MSSYGKDDRYDPFSNGHEYRLWLSCNCDRDERGCRNYKPNATSSRHGCPIEVAIAFASVGDGKISMHIALRGGFVEPATGGRLTDDHRWTADGARVIPQCPEYRGYDERDDRPRRVPHPPADQCDLLDPRNEPSKEQVVA
jgi:hypothetical protein